MTVQVKAPRSKFVRSRNGVAALAALLLILFLFRPGVYKLRNRIAVSIGSALSRRVALDNVRLRLLPRPGFDLEGLVIYDDPSFSAEPMIRAQNVSAAIRLRSLLRGRLEIATLSASEPSINLVRNMDGRWNLASLIERNALIPAAPTAKPSSERRPAFPYLEASNARINFKLGQTKKSYALMNADVALWQDSENSWDARMKAEPVRTDFNLTDTGWLQITASWQRAVSLRMTPVQIAVQWRNGQLGQITKLLSGKDRGWRGGVDLTANLSGTPEALMVDSAASIDLFHRYDIVGSENVRLATACSGRYNAVTSALVDLFCESPVGSGALRLHGNFAMAAKQPAYDLTLVAERVPLTSLVHLLRQAKKQVPGDLTSTGLLNGEVRARRGETWTGTGTAINVRLVSNSGRDQVALGAIPLELIAVPSTGSSSPSRPAQTQDLQRYREFRETRLRIGPVPLAINASAPLDAGGWISTTGYRFFMRGDVELKDLFGLEQLLGLPVTRPAAQGESRLDAGVSGQWQGFAPPVIAGTAQLRNVRAEMRGLNTPIEIGSASVTLNPDAVLLEKISARTGSTHWSGRVTALRHCALPSTIRVAPLTVPNCVFRFDLAADQLSPADLAEWFTPHATKRPWYRILNSNTSDPATPSPLLAIEAHGSLRVDRLGLKKALASQVATQLDLDRGKITLTALRAQLLQGTHQGNWTIDMSNPDAVSQPLRYRGAGTLRDISLSQVATLMDDAWITGTADGKFEVEGSGNNFGELLARSAGKLNFVMRNGSLPHIEMPGSSLPLSVHRFAGELHLITGAAWDLSASLESPDGVYQVGGTASPVNGFKFLLTRGHEQSWTLTGPLAKPHLSAVERTDSMSAEVNAKTVNP